MAHNVGAQELCESRNGRPGLSNSNSHYGLCGREATLGNSFRAQELGDSRGGRPDSRHGLCGRKTKLNLNYGSYTVRV